MSYPITSQKNNLPYLLSIAIGLLFIAVAVTILHYGHVHEDAYILFQYSKNVSNGFGIVFDKLSGHTEGATDFLWMILLAVFNSLGVDFGLAAAIVNGVGLSLITLLIFRLHGSVDIKSVLVVGLVIFSGGTAAALGGFSTLAYGGLFALFIVALLEKRFYGIAVLAVVLPLFRPDAALLVLGGVLSMLIYAEKNESRMLVVALIPSVFVGIIYFLWRFNYFDSILPLPLLVKAKTERLFEGADNNLYALKYYFPLLLPIVYLVIKNKTDGLLRRKLFVILIGSLFLFIALLFAHQSQNIGNRFQFPIVLSLSLMYLVCYRKQTSIPQFFVVLPLFGILFGAQNIIADTRYLTNDDYINSFPQLLQKNKFLVNNISVTEAGRFPFWFSSERVTDLVGLNSANVVRSGPEKVLRELKPKLIFVHHAGSYDVAKLDSTKSYIVMESKDILKSTKYYSKNPEFLAAQAALDFAVYNSYQAILVQYGKADKNFSHVYFLSNDLGIEKFILVLEKSMTTKISYYDSLRLAQRQM